MVAVMIGVDPHKSSHTAVAISPAEEPLGELRVRASASQVQRLLAWAQAWPQRTWAIEGAGGLGHLLAQQLLAAGEQVFEHTITAADPMPSDLSEILDRIYRHASAHGFELTRVQEHIGGGRTRATHMGRG
jgi:hypothetical protein